MLGVGFGVLREIMDAGFRTKEQVQFALEMECVALVPRLEQGNSKLGAKKGAGRTSSALTRQTIYTEAIRSIKLTVDQNEESSDRTSNETFIGKVIGVTSCLPREGKSTIAAGMASFIARGGARVVLVDCDVRNPSLSRALAPDAKIGIVELLCGKADPANAILHNSASG